MLKQLGYAPNEALFSQLERIINNTTSFEKIKKHILDLHEHLKVDDSHVAMSNSEDYFKIKIEAPSPELTEEAIEKVEEIAEKNGILSMLSIPDIKVLALAYEKKIPIVTDDYDIQNMCWHMGLGFETIALPGIKEAISWKKKCTACGKTYDTDVIDNYGNPVVKHYTLLDPGECDHTGCVIHEYTAQDGLLYQWYDHTNDGVCNRIIVWKKLIDPTWGT